MTSTAKEWQFAKLAGLGFCGIDNDGELEWLGTRQQFQEYRELQAQDDRGEFYSRYPWQPIEF